MPKVYFQTFKLLSLLQLNIVGVYFFFLLQKKKQTNKPNKKKQTNKNK